MDEELGVGGQRNALVSIRVAFLDLQIRLAVDSLDGVISAFQIAVFVDNVLTIGILSNLHGEDAILVGGNLEQVIVNRVEVLVAFTVGEVLQVHSQIISEVLRGGVVDGFLNSLNVIGDIRELLDSAGGGLRIIDANDVSVHDSSALVLEGDPSAVDDSPVGGVSSVLHADHVAVSVIEEGVGAVLVGLGQIIAHVEVLGILDVFAVNAGLGRIGASGGAELVAGETAVLTFSDIDSLDALIVVRLVAVIIERTEGVGEQDIVVLLQTGGIIEGQLSHAIIVRILEGCAVTGVASFVHLAAVVVVVLFESLEVVEVSVQLDSAVALDVVVVSSGLIGDLGDLAEPSLDGGDGVVLVAISVLAVVEDLGQSALCAVLCTGSIRAVAVAVLPVSFVISVLVSVIVDIVVVEINGVVAIAVDFIDEDLGLGVGLLDAQSDKQFASGELFGEGDLRSLHDLNRDMILGPLGVGTIESVGGVFLLEVEVLVQSLAGLDSAGNSQVQLAAEGDNAVLLGRLPVRGLSFLCVLDSVSVQSVQKDLSSLFTGQVLLGLPAVSQIVDQADLLSKSQNVDCPGSANKAFLLLIVAQGDQSHLQELGAGDVGGGSIGGGVHAGDDACAIAVANIGLAPTTLFIGKGVDGGVVGADVCILVVKDGDDLSSLFTSDGCSGLEVPVGIALHCFDEIKDLDRFGVIRVDLVGVLVLSRRAGHGCQTQQGCQNQNQRKNLFEVLH